MQDITRETLIKAREGDLESFEAVYNAASGFVYNVALRIVNNKEDAEEVAQEVFLSIYNKLKKFRFESSFKTWVYRITANSAINFAKKMSKIRNKTVRYEDASDVERLSAGHQDKTSVIDTSEMVKQLLGSLNPEQRACIVLRNIEGLSYAEIAKSLRININTVRSRLKRARERLLALKEVGHEYM
jgi:RNA polymerase sigma-70 factor (ECF subfamily)